MSWQLVAILFAVSSFEGVRRLGPEDMVLRCNPFGVWSVVYPTRLWRDWHLVSVLPPFFLTMTLSPDRAADGLSESERDVSHFAKSIEPILALRMLGAIVFLAMIPGIPWGVSRYASAGLFSFLGCALASSAAIALRAAGSLIGEGESRRIVFRKTLSFLSPFASPLAAETVLAARTRRYSRATTLSDLLGEARFRALVRRSAYDVQSRAAGMRDSWLEEIVLSLSENERATILESASDGCTPLECYCPRCGEKYLLGPSICSECEGVPLIVRQPGPASTLS